MPEYRKTPEEERRIATMCRFIGSDIGEKTCDVLESTLYAAKSTIKDWNGRRVFIQDLTAALNRRDIIVDSEEYEEFNRLGYEYMEE